MPIDEARIRELIGVEADVDVEAELQKIIDAAKAATDPAAAAKAAADKAAADKAAADKAAADAAAAAAGGAGTGAAPGATSDAGTGAAGTGAAAEPVGAGASHLSATTLAELKAAGVVLLSAGAAQELQAQAQAGASALAQLDGQARQAHITGALREGRISAHEATTNFAAGGPWASYMERPPTELATFLSGLTPRFAVTEVGHGQDGDVSQLGEDAWTSWETETFPELAAQHAAAAKS